MKQFTRWRNKLKRKNEIEKLISPNKIMIVFDTETTGLGDTAKIIQFSAIKYRFTENLELKELDQKDIYINPNETLSPKITEITGITDDMLKDKPDEKEIAEDIFGYLEEADIICGYNVEFDIRMIHLMESRTRLCFDEPPSLDVCEMARDWVYKADISNHKLQTVVEYIHPCETFQFHSAIEDVKATALLFEDFYEMYSSYEDDQSDKEYMHLEKASLFINPRKKSEKRIKLTLNAGQSGDIFWDIVNQEWGCCTNTRAKQYFNSINLCNLEEQFLSMYGYKFGSNTPKAVAQTWLNYKRTNVKGA